MVSFCFLISNDYATHVFTYDNLGFVKKEIESDMVVGDIDRKYGLFLEEQMIEVVVAIKKSDDSQLLEKHFNGITDKVIVYTDEVTDGKAYNDMARICTGDEICFVQPNLFVRHHWLTDLLFYKKSIPRSGAVSLLNNLRGYDFLPMLSTEDETSINVFIPKNSYMDDWGVMLISRQHFYFVGALTEDVSMLKCEWVHWQMRAMGLGLTNYCIPTIACYVPFHSDSGFNQQAMTEVEKSIKEMRRAKNYYLPL